jgi:tetratricopeptide (TPR) repeat protein
VNDERFLSVEGERAWTYLRRHLDRSEAFWLGFVLTADVRAADLLRERTSWNRRARAEPLLAIVADRPADLDLIPDRLDLEAPLPAGCTWIQGTGLGQDWADAWGRLLQALNHRRDSLRDRLGGLVLVGPPTLKEQAQRTAADLWSVRDLLTEVHVVRPDTEAAPVVLERLEQSSVDVSGLSLGDSDVPEAVALLAMEPSRLATTERRRTVDAIAAAHRQGDTQAAAVLSLALANGYLAERDRAGARDWVETVVKDERVDDDTRIRAYDSAVRLTQELGDLPSAERHARDWLKLAEGLAERSGTPETLRDLSISLEKVGNIHSAQGNLTAAEEAYTQSLEIRENLARRTGTPEAVRDLSISLEKVGNVRTARGDYTAAENAYTRSLELAERLAERSGTPETLRDLSISLEKVGNIRRTRNDLTAAEDAYTRSLKIRERLARETNTPEALRDLSVSLNKIGDIRRARGDLAAAETAYVRSLNIRERLAEQTGTPQALQDVPISLEQVGNIRSARGNFAAAEDAYNRSLDLREHLAEQTGTLESLRDLSISLEKVGNVRTARGDYTAAEDAYARALELAERLAETDTPEALRDLSLSLNNVGNICRTQGRTGAADDAYTRSLKLAERLADQTGTPDALYNLAHVLDQLATLRNNGGLRRRAAEITARIQDMTER